MSPEVIERVFSAVSEIPPELRGAKLKELCRDDTGLIDEVRSLLNAADKAGGFLCCSPASIARPPVNTQSMQGTRVGAYSIVRLLGSGGMGSVYLAERADGQYQQQVAVKIVGHRFVSENELLRFRTERQILAELEHPYITRLLDAGELENRQLYLVMEYIQGEPIDVYCKNNKLSIAQILRLFCQVCEGVEHAHQQQVIHRDLKPANIFVTRLGLPKLFDFGIAKLLDAPALKQQPLTMDGMLLMTPEYAAPEQMNGATPSVRCDIYALGVILYELLTGTRPHDFNGMGILQIAQHINHTEPSMPSEKAPPVLRPALRGTLDNIVAKALHKQPQLRYPSVRHLIDDIQRYLDGRPVCAAQTSLGPRASNRLASLKPPRRVALPVLFLALSLGTLATLWQWNSTRSEQAKTLHAQNQIRELVNTLVFEANETLRLPLAKESISQSALEIGVKQLDELAHDNPADPALRRDLGATYDKLATFQGNPMMRNLGDTDGALAGYRKAIALRTQLQTQNPGDMEAVVDLAESYRNFSALVGSLGDFNQARAHAEQCITLLEPFAQTRTNRYLLYFTECHLASAHWSNGLGDTDSAARTLERLSALYQALPRQLHPVLKEHKDRYLEEMAALSANRGDLSGAITLQHQLVNYTLKRSKRRPAVRIKAIAYQGLGKLLSRNNEPEQAEAAFLESLVAWQALVDNTGEDVSKLRGLAGIHADLALTQRQISEHAVDKETKTLYLNKSCRSFHASVSLLHQLPDTKIGFGARLFGLPSPGEFQTQFESICQNIV